MTCQPGNLSTNHLNATISGNDFSYPVMLLEDHGYAFHKASPHSLTKANRGRYLQAVSCHLLRMPQDRNSADFWVNTPKLKCHENTE